jgi:hypothetical protein
VKVKRFRVISKSFLFYLGGNLLNLIYRIFGWFTIQNFIIFLNSRKGGGILD